MFKILSGLFWSVGMIIFAVWILIPTDQNERLERACKPIQVVGGIGVSITEVVHNSWADDVQNAVDHVDYTCRYTLWNQFFKKDYEQWKMQENQLHEDH